MKHGSNSLGSCFAKHSMLRRALRSAVPVGNGSEVYRDISDRRSRWAQNIKPEEMQPLGTHSPGLVWQSRGGMPACRQCAGASSVRKSVVGMPACCRCASPWAVPKRIVGVLAHGRCSSAWSVLRPPVGAQTALPRTGAQQHARPGPTRRCT
jgi:hypothetical protein